MIIKSNNAEGGATRKLIEVGTHEAYIMSIVDCGTHYDSTYNKDNRQLVISVEFPEEVSEIEVDGEKKELTQVRSVSANATWGGSTNQSKLRKIVESVIGRELTSEEIYDTGYDLESLLGTPVMASILHKESTKEAGKFYDNINTFSPPTTKQVAKFCKPTRETFIFDLDNKESVVAEWGKLPKWMKEKIRKSKQWPSVQAMVAQDGDSQQSPQPQAEVVYAKPKSSKAQGFHNPPEEKDNLDDDDLPF